MSTAILGVSGQIIENPGSTYVREQLRKLVGSEFIDVATVLDLENILADAEFGGTVVPSSNPAPTVNTYYFATQAGTYTNMGGVVVGANSIAIISFVATGSVWSISQTEFNVDGFMIKSVTNTIGSGFDSSYNAVHPSNVSTRILYQPLGLDGNISKLTIRSGRIGILECGIFSRSGDVFTLVGSSFNITLATVGTLNTITTGLPTGVQSDYYFGWYVQNPTSAAIGYKTVTGVDSWLFTGTGMASGVTFTHVTTIDFGIQVEVQTVNSDEGDVYAAIAASDLILQEQLPILSSETIDFASFTSVSTSTQTRIMSTPSAIDGIISTIKTNVTRGGLLKFKIFSKNVDGTFNLVLEKNVYTSLGINEIELNMPIAKGQYFGWYHGVDAFVGFKSTSAIWFAYAAGDLVGNNNAVTTTTTIDFGVSLNIIPVNFKGLVKTTADTSVRSALSPIGTINNSLFYSTSLPSGWINTTGFIPTTTGLQSPASGSWATVAYWDKLVVLDEDITMAKVIINDDTSIFAIVRESAQGAGTAIEIDCSTLKMNLYGVVATIGGTPAALVKSVTIPAIVEGREYHIIMKKTSQIYDFSFIDSVTQVTTVLSFSAVGTTKDIGRCWNSPGIVFRSGDIKLLEMNLSSPLPRAAKVAEFGDSISEGDTIRTLAGGGYKNRWAGLLSTSINNNISIFARAGETTTDMNSKLSDITAWFTSPKYAIYAMGMNDNTFSTWQTNMNAWRTVMEAKGAEIILITLHPRVGLEAFNTAVTNYVLTSGYKYIDFAKALTVNGDRVTRDTALLLPDLLHPNVAGHLKMFKQVQLDCPYLF
jgi:lysophospholipase L1-like esterase